MRVFRVLDTQAFATIHRRTTRYTLEELDSNELVDVQALGTTDSSDSPTDAVLTLERAGTAADGYTVQLFESYLDSSRDVSICDKVTNSSCSTAADAVEKIPVQNLGELGQCSRSVNGDTELSCRENYIPGIWTPLQIDNFEAMAIGPTIGDGRRTLLLVNDDKYNAQERGTHFVLLALDEEHDSEFTNLTATDDDPLRMFGYVLLGLFIFVTWRLYDERHKPQEEQVALVEQKQPDYTEKGTKFTNPEAAYSDLE